MTVVRGSAHEAGRKFARRARQAVRELRALLNGTHDPAGLAAKARDFRVFTRRTLLVTGLFVLTTILWDFAIDPRHAPEVIDLRLGQCALVLAWAAAGWRDPHARLARLCSLVVPLGVEMLFVMVLGRLHNGPVYGVGGFLYFFIFVPFLTLAQPLALSVLALVLVAICPWLMGVAGVPIGWPWPVYWAYVGLAFMPVIVIRALFESLYRTVLHYRRRIEHQAVTDELTALPNRRHFMHRAEQALAERCEGERVALMFVDIDHFKTVNDHHGHAVGDRALGHVAHTLQAALGGRGLLARYGGEEFVVLLHGTGSEAARGAAERLRRAVREAPVQPQHVVAPLRLTVSIGLAATPRAARAAGLDALLRAADDALYRAKRGGRDRVVEADDIAGDPPARRTAAQPGFSDDGREMSS